jgi:hypothetical protein
MAALSERLRSIVRSWDVATIWIAGIAASAFVLFLAVRAVDVLAILLVCAGVFVLERTVGDWLTDALGPFVSKVVFLGGIFVCFTIALSFESVRTGIWNGIEAADNLGLHSVLLEGVEQMPSVDTKPAPSTASTRASGSGQSSPGGSEVPSSTPSSPSEPAAAAPTPSVRGEEAPTGARTRVVLRIGGQGSTVLLQADVLSEGAAVNDGRVEFIIDDRRATSAGVSAGRAEGRATVGPGAHRVQARYTGTRDFRESIAEVAFAR